MKTANLSEKHKGTNLHSHANERMNEIKKHNTSAMQNAKSKAGSVQGVKNEADNVNQFVKINSFIPKSGYTGT